MVVVVMKWCCCLGEYQCNNAALALATALLLRKEGRVANHVYGSASKEKEECTRLHAFQEGDFPNGVQRALQGWSSKLTDVAFREGLESTWLPFRFQLLQPSSSSMVAADPKLRVVVDGGTSTVGPGFS